MDINTIIQTVILIITFLAVVVPFVWAFISLLVKTKGKLVSFATALITAISVAELTDATGEEKRKTVTASMIKWCNDNGLAITEKKLNNMINLTVAIANLLVRFAKKKISGNN